MSFSQINVSPVFGMSFLPVNTPAQQCDGCANKFLILVSKMLFFFFKLEKKKLWTEVLSSNLASTSVIWEQQHLPFELFWGLELVRPIQHTAKHWVSVSSLVLCLPWQKKNPRHSANYYSKMVSPGNNGFSKVTDLLPNILKPQLGLCKRNSVPHFNSKSFYHCFKASSWKPYL